MGLQEGVTIIHSEAQEGTSGKRERLRDRQVLGVLGDAGSSGDYVGTEWEIKLQRDQKHVACAQQ